MSLAVFVKLEHALLKIRLVTSSAVDFTFRRCGILRVNLRMRENSEGAYLGEAPFDKANVATGFNVFSEVLWLTI